MFKSFIFFGYQTIGIKQHCYHEVFSEVKKFKVVYYVPKYPFYWYTGTAHFFIPGYLKRG